MKERIARVDAEKNPPMQYLVADGCPKLLDGHAFYACACSGPSIPEQDKPGILAECEFLMGTRVDTETRVLCAHGAWSTGHPVRFCATTVMHADDSEDGSLD